MKWAGLRVGLVGPVPPPAGGMANQTRQLAELLTAEGALVTLVAVNAPYRPAWIGRFKGLRALGRLLPYLAALWRCAGQVRLIHLMANSGWSWHLFAAPAVWIARLRGVPVVVNYRGGEAGAFLDRAIGWVRPTLAAASLLAVPSGFLREVFARYGVAAEVLPNIVDLSRFRRLTAREPAAPHLVVTRNLEPIYDIATAIEAFAIVRAARPDARLSVAGSGPELARLREQTLRLGLGDAVSFTGRLDRDQVAALYQDADLMINSSLVDNMPNSVLEALASALPVVSTRVGGVPYIVRDGVTALLVDPGDARAMAAAALRILGDPELAASLAAAGVADVQQYTWARVRGRLGELYDRALAGRALRVNTA